jgi:hypothetical protein
MVLDQITSEEVVSTYLRRLERLKRLRNRHEQELNDQGVRLLNRTIFEAYCVLRDIGAEDKARQLLQEPSVLPVQEIAS